MGSASHEVGLKGLILAPENGQAFDPGGHFKDTRDPFHFDHFALTHFSGHPDTLGWGGGWSGVFGPLSCLAGGSSRLAAFVHAPCHDTLLGFSI